MRGLDVVADDWLLSLSIEPQSAESGYGYIQRGEKVSEGCWRIASFIEKPAPAIAKQFLDEGGRDWNSGMFMFKASVYLQELQRHHPDMLAACRRSFAAAERRGDFIFLPEAEYRQCPSQSIDYAVMEHTDRAAALQVACGWSDGGSWDLLWQAARTDADGNASIGDVIAYEAQRNYLRSSSRLLAVCGVSDLIVVETPDAVLVCRRGAGQQVGKLVERLNALGRSEATEHTRVRRPWGYYENLGAGEGYLVKLLSVDSAQQLSLQRHSHRSEHWVVICGQATVTVGEEQCTLGAGRHVLIPQGSWHRLANQTDEPLQLIEVQMGARLEESDIERVADDYGRAPSQ